MAIARIVTLAWLSMAAASTAQAETTLASIAVTATPDASLNAVPDAVGPSDGAAPATPDRLAQPGGYFATWFNRVRAAQESQPHWITPIATVTPRLEEEFRYDFGFQHLGNGADIANYGLGRGLELIPTKTSEIILNVPPYIERSNRKPGSGFGDDPVLLIKQRFLSANEENGNYILTGFLGLQAPTGIALFSNESYIITPTIAGGKGWGRFDFQATFGVAFPLEHVNDIGTAFITNVAFQYHYGKIFWPEFEVNYTHWDGGPRDGKDQVFLTPGIIFGRFPISGRVKAIVGVADQIAVSPRLTTVPVITPLYKNQVILTTRMTF